MEGIGSYNIEREREKKNRTAFIFFSFAAAAPKKSSLFDDDSEVLPSKKEAAVSPAVPESTGLVWFGFPHLHSSVFLISAVAPKKSSLFDDAVDVLSPKKDAAVAPGQIFFLLFLIAPFEVCVFETQPPKSLDCLTITRTCLRKSIQELHLPVQSPVRMVCSREKNCGVIVCRSDPIQTPSPVAPGQ